MAKKVTTKRNPPLVIEGSKKPFAFRIDPDEIEQWRRVAEVEGTDLASRCTNTSEQIEKLVEKHL
jgi:hypothetical protein